MVRRINFFRQCSRSDWARYGEVIAGKQHALVQEMVKAREERARTVRVFEEELKGRDRRVDERMEKTKQFMARARANVGMLF